MFSLLLTVSNQLSKNFHSNANLLFFHSKHNVTFLFFTS